MYAERDKDFNEFDTADKLDRFECQLDANRDASTPTHALWVRATTESTLLSTASIRPEQVLRSLATFSTAAAFMPE